MSNLPLSHCRAWGENGMAPWWVLTILLTMATTVVFAIDQDDLLKPDQAFSLTVESVDADTVTATWRIAEGYYLYRERFSFKPTDAAVRLGTPRLPAGKFKEDPFFGTMEIYRGQVTATIPVRHLDGRQLGLEIGYQGCAEIGICYPPQSQTVRVDLPGADDQLLLKDLVNGDRSLKFGQFRQQPLLEADQAFILSLTAPDPQTLVARWDIAEGYYLYRDKISLTLDDAEGVSIADIAMPAGVPQEDEFFGRQAVFYDQVTVTAELEHVAAGERNFRVKVDYQGCAEVGVCYPPMSQTIPVALTVPTPFAQATVGGGSTSGRAIAEAEQDRIARLLQERRFLAMPAFFGFGLLLAFTPCVFPMIPILSGLIIGQGQQLNRIRAFLLSLVYVLAMAVTYTIAGVLAAFLGSNIQALFQEPWVVIGFASLFVLLALSMFGFYDLQLPSRWQSRLAELSNRSGGGRYTGVAVMGLLSALIVGPCVAPPLIGVLTVIGTTGDAFLGGSALFALSLGMGMPLLLIGASAGHWLPRAGRWMNLIKAVFGVLLLAVALWLLERILPVPIIMLLWAILLIVCAVYMGALHGGQESSRWYPLVRGLGMVLLIYGILLLVGVAAGGRDPLQPLRGVGLMAGDVEEKAQFQSVDSVAQLERILARTEGRSVMLDFYADWCVSCKELEKYTFSDPQVQAALADTLLLQADVTANDKDDQALLRRFGLIGPPAILFFGPDGVERRPYRLVGFIGADAFHRHLQQALSPQQEV